MGSREFFGSVLLHREGTKIILSEAADMMAGWLLGGIFSTDLIPDKNEWMLICDLSKKSWWSQSSPN